jgi:hypothetical protein
MSLRKNTQSLAGQRPRLVKPSLRHPPAMQRYGNNQHRCRSLGSHLRNRIRQPRAKFPGNRSHPVVLQRMDSGAHRPFIHAKADRPDKRRRSHSTGAAQISFRRLCLECRFKQILTAANTAILTPGRELAPTGCAYRCLRDIGQRTTAKSATRGKKSATQHMTQTTQKISGRKSRCAQERSRGDTSRYIPIFETRVATEVAPQSRQASPRCLEISIRRRE